MTTAKTSPGTSLLMSAQGLVTSMPSLAAIVLETPLYEVVPVPDESVDTRHLYSLRYGTFQFDAHCMNCGKTSTFKAEATGNNPELDSARKPGEFSRKFNCQRYRHTYAFYFVVGSEGIRKIGQWPSLEDIAGADIEKYRHQLKDHFGELRKATGLASHGIGIGAFVYLRRIFERIIYRHAGEQASPIVGFDGMRMDEKLTALKSVLPPAVYRHRAAYAILSKGLHELDEDTCKRYFPFVRQAIIAMLEQDWVAREAKKADDELEAQFQKISGELNVSGNAKPG